MQSVSPEFAVTLVSLFVNVMMAFITTKIKVEISELKTLLYKEFVTKEDLAKRIAK